MQLFTSEMLAISDAELAQKLKAKRESDTNAVLEKDARVSAEYNC